MTPMVLTVKKSSVLEIEQQFPLESGINKIGRVKQPDCSLVIPERSVSRNHCEVHVHDDGRLELVDLGSGNGTFLNGRRVRGKSDLKAGDTLQIGDTYLAVERRQEQAPLISESTQVMSREEVAKVHKAMPTPGPAASPAAQDVSLKPWQRRKVRIAVAAVMALLVVSLLLKVIFSGGKEPIFPTPDSLTHSYTGAQDGFRFKHPSGWQRVARSRRDAFAYTYFTHSIHHFSGKANQWDVHFVVDILEGVPPQISLKEMVQPGRDRFPRTVSHGEKLTDARTVTVAGQEAMQVVTPPFEHRGITIQAMETYFRYKDRRYLLIGATARQVFQPMQSFFEAMTLSLELENVSTLTDTLAMPKDVNREVRLIKQSAENLVVNRNIAAENLFQATQFYRRGALLLNLHGFEGNDPLRLELLSQFQSALKSLEERYSDMKFKMDRDIKLKNWKSVYHTAGDILALIPDPEDERYRYAQTYYQYYLKTTGQM